MSLFRSAFWTEKGESLAHDLVGAFVKAVLIAVLAFVVMEYARQALERYNKRQALVAFQNGAIENAINDLQDMYMSRLSCVDSLGQFKKESCLTELKLLQLALGRQQAFIQGILNRQQSLDFYPPLQRSVNALVDVHGADSLAGSELEKLAEETKTGMLKAINGMAQEIR